MGRWTRNCLLWATSTPPNQPPMLTPRMSPQRVYSLVRLLQLTLYAWANDGEQTSCPTWISPPTPPSTTPSYPTPLLLSDTPPRPVSYLQPLRYFPNSRPSSSSRSGSMLFLAQEWWRSRLMYVYFQDIFPSSESLESSWIFGIWFSLPKWLPVAAYRHLQIK